MKCITYVSQAVARKSGLRVPTGLAEILIKARKTNDIFDITGILSYKNGYYIQVIEGEDNVIDQLFSNIKSDPRHENVETIMEFPIVKRSFPDWEMRILESTQRDPFFHKFMTLYAGRFESINKRDAKLLARFYNIQAVQKGLSNGYNGKALRLTAWPDFSILKQSPVIIELCARLIKEPQTYQHLLSNGDFGTQRQLDSILGKFGALQILKITDAVNENNNKKNEEKPKGFYSKMKTFLSRR